MSQQRKKQTKTFLKKGTRQFLSNAQVRSQSDKPKIVQFENENAEFNPPKNSFRNIESAKEEDLIIPIKVKPNKFGKQAEIKSTPPVAEKRSKQNKSFNQEKQAIPQQSSGKKKPAVLEDYISRGKRDSFNRNDSKEKQIPAKSTMTYLLKKQVEESDSDDDHQHIKIEPIKEDKKEVIVNNSEYSEKVNIISDDSDAEQVNQKKILNKYAKPSVQDKQIQKNRLQNQNNWDSEQNQGTPEQRTTSKVLEKYYKKIPEPELQPQISKQQNLQSGSKLAIKDIPIELKQQIINETIENHKDMLAKKVEELKAQIFKTQQVKSKYEADQKQLNAEKQSFQREMEQKNRQFEQKLKNQNNKLNRQKRYMKDIQLAGKGDWKVKSEVEDLRKALEEANHEKKKIQVKLRGQIDRLKKRLDEEVENCKSLTSQIKCLQVNRVLQKEQTKEQIKQVQTSLKRNYWVDAPTKSYVSSFIEDNFTLISLDYSQYHYESIQYYKYYLKHQNDTQGSELLSQKSDESKIVRRYRNGKEEVQYISQILKQSFPFNFSIVSFQNGDVKLSLPEGVIVYYDTRNNIIQFKVTPSKIIYNFLNESHVEMKVTSANKIILHEILAEGILTRRDLKGETKYTVDKSGKVIKLH